MNSKKDKFEDEMRIEGIKIKGYGVIPKVVMIDIDLSFTARTIYAYFRSLSGRGKFVFPGRDTIVHDLRISKEAYYKGLKELTDAGYVSKTQEKSSNGKFKRNIYTIHDFPEKYRHCPTDNPSKEKMYREIMEHGIESQGYGLIPHAVMVDQRMKYHPKGTYAYLSSYIGDDPSADLAPTLIAYHLGISSPHTVQGYMKQLIELNYIKVARLTENGRYTEKSRYFRVQNPDKKNAQTKIQYENIMSNVTVLSLPNAENQDTVAPNVKKQDTVAPNVKKQDTVEPNVKKQDTVEPNVKKQDTGKQDAEKPDTIITSSTITSFTTTSSTNTSILIDRLITRVRNAISYEIMCWTYDNSPAEREALDNLILVIAETLASNNPRISISGTPYLASFVREVLLKINSDAVYHVLERFLSRIDKIAPQNHKQYLLTSIFNELIKPINSADGCEAEYSVP